MASYKRWMNERLYAICADLTDEQRRSDTGAFFRSVHGTLNHLLLGDRVWMGRFAGRPFSIDTLDQELYADFAELRSQRAITDDEIDSWASDLTDETLAAKLQYTSIVNPSRRTYDMWVCVVHFFNHQTHHRGQLTTLLSQRGNDYGLTDLIWLPSVLSEN